MASGTVEEDRYYLDRARGLIEHAGREGPQSEIMWVLAAALGLAIAQSVPSERAPSMMTLLAQVSGVASAYEYRRLAEIAAQLAAMVPWGRA